VALLCRLKNSLQPIASAGPALVAAVPAMHPCAPTAAAGHAAGLDAAAAIAAQLLLLPTGSADAHFRTGVHAAAAAGIVAGPMLP